MANEEIRKEAKDASVPLWRIAEALHVSEPTMTRKMRRELTLEDQQKIRAAIADLKVGA